MHILPQHRLVLRTPSMHLSNSLAFSANGAHHPIRIRVTSTDYPKRTSYIVTYASDSALTGIGNWLSVEPTLPSPPAKRSEAF